MSHFNDLAVQMGAGDSDLTPCKFCGRVSCEGDCYEVRRYVREYEAALEATDAAFRATMEAGR